uniref:Uncharacterized protein n=1 Tax=viral metagenome TaxID=1070528 RepID=A0A6C0EZ14_9ZZZZ
MQSTLNILYSTIKTKKKKERFETILEPLQAILQIGYLSFAPIGTKLTIQNNILKIQIPNYSQPVIRWYNNDTQEDLFYLFNIFYRFKKFYHFLNDSKTNPENKKLYDLLIELAKSGIGNLIRTYSQTDKIHILHTLQMYKNILEGDGNGNGNGHGQKRFDSHEISNLSNSHESHASHSGGGGGSFMTSKREKEKDKKTKTMQKILRDDSPELDQEPEHERAREHDNAYEMKNDAVASVASHCNSNEIKNIDDVFIRITDIYTQDIYNIIYNTLTLMGKNDAECNIYIDGLNKILEPTNNRIKKWIDENIVF